MSVGESITVSSRNTTAQTVTQTVYTFYEVGSRVDARVTRLQNSDTLMSAWGDEKYQLLHLRDEGSGDQQLTVFYYRASYSLGTQVTKLDNLQAVAERPSTTDLIYDIY